MTPSPSKAKISASPGAACSDKPGAFVKGHHNEFHFVIMNHVHIDDLAFRIGNKLSQSEYFTCFDCFVHDIAPPDFNFCIDCAGYRFSSR